MVLLSQFRLAIWGMAARVASREVAKIGGFAFLNQILSCLTMDEPVTRGNARPGIGTGVLRPLRVE